MLSLSISGFGEGFVMDLSGEWGFQTDVMDFRRGSLSPRYNHRLQSTIQLPGTTDDNRIGYENPYSYVDRLTRLYEYMAPAWYQRDIAFPQEWEGKRIFLYMERTHWLSCVWVDTQEVSRQDYVSVPHIHDITDFVTPGTTHRITLCIDNRFQYDTHKWDHAHTEFTQVNWNGILGDFKLLAVDPVYLEDLQMFPDPENGRVEARFTIRNTREKAVDGLVTFTVTGPDGRQDVVEQPVCSEPGENLFTATIRLSDCRLWDEFHPDLYLAEARLASDDGGSDSRSATFGMRSIGRDRHHIWINGHPVHLRGTVENAVFPQTGHTPMDEDSWARIMRICKDYGLNHMRFHSWCPPDAAFRAADKAGVYLEIEMPMWGKDALEDEARYNFFRREVRAILKEYGNHPSFLLYCNGNEIQGNFDFVEELTAAAIAQDSRHLYSGSTARARVPSDQYYISQDTPKGPAKVYEGRPGTDWDTNEACDVDVPVISHESGQRCIYPHFTEIEKYHGPVRARNLERWRDLLAARGMAGQAEVFFRASGALTVLEYKCVMEAHLRSSNSAGFQLLSLNDFTGQGYAPVGILDPFWDSKGLVTPEEWRRFCAPSTVLLRYPKSVYYSDETFTGKIEVYNYTDQVRRAARAEWKVCDASGKTLLKGVAGRMAVSSYGVFNGPSFKVNLSSLKVQQARQLTLSVKVDGFGENAWKLWVYPHQDMPVSDAEVLYAHQFDDEAKDRLEAGGTVVLMPDPERVEGRRSVFHNHFWNPVMFAWEPMTLGCLIDPDNPIFDGFPTSYHTDFQWYGIIPASKVIDLQEGPADLCPFIQVIDAFDSNRKLGLGFEARLGNGKLVVFPLRRDEALRSDPAALQLLNSIDAYVHSLSFNPDIQVDEAFIASFLK